MSAAERRNPIFQFHIFDLKRLAEAMVFVVPIFEGIGLTTFLFSKGQPQVLILHTCFTTVICIRIKRSSVTLRIVHEKDKFS